jgi:hypothetical protein
VVYALVAVALVLYFAFRKAPPLADSSQKVRSDIDAMGAAQVENSQRYRAREMKKEQDFADKNRPGRKA